MTDFELMKAILEKAYSNEPVYFAPDESEITIDYGASFYFHPGGEIDSIHPHAHVIEDESN